MTNRQFQQRTAAVKALHYFTQSGARGLLLRQIVRDGEGFVGLGLDDATVYRNIYVTIDEIPIGGGSIRELIEKYDPATQAVCVIEYESGCQLQPEILSIQEDPDTSEGVH